MLFRFHRRFLDEAMETVREFNSKEELEQIVGEAVTVKKYGTGIDERIGWDTYIVCDKDGIPIGFTNGAANMIGTATKAGVPVKVIDVG